LPAPQPGRLTLSSAPGDSGQTCVALQDATRPRATVIIRRCTYGIVRMASIQRIPQGPALVLAVQPLESWRELCAYSGEVDRLFRRNVTGRFRRVCAVVGFYSDRSRSVKISRTKTRSAASAAEAPNRRDRTHAWTTAVSRVSPWRRSWRPPAPASILSPRDGSDAPGGSAGPRSHRRESDRRCSHASR
jgi:hypothetical protein